MTLLCDAQSTGPDGCGAMTPSNIISSDHLIRLKLLSQIVELKRRLMLILGLHILDRGKSFVYMSLLDR
jgi:hypothetical protein